MLINLGKTKEIIFITLESYLTALLVLALPIFGIEQISSAKLLGVYIQENFSCEMHFKHIITVSSQTLHI